MANILPQQELFLELLIMSGDIAIASGDEDTILQRTLQECKAKGWVNLTPFGAGFNKASITPTGRTQVKISK
ncbi:MAG: hypothetical protein OQK35_07500 [Alphaproteobacteria bacterium]|nr:hypothetical protein [Rhodospirillales bacterium]MCW9046163.1 hypothetical protein [Alphaproteobacteria bacterium]